MKKNKYSEFFNGNMTVSQLQNNLITLNKDCPDNEFDLLKKAYSEAFIVAYEREKKEHQREFRVYDLILQDPSKLE